MKRLLLYSGFLLFVYGSSVNLALAQAPSFTYSPQTNVFSTGTAITALTPNNSGGAVPATTYSTVSTFATGLNLPRGLVSDGSGNIYETDFGGNVINKITSAGSVSIFSGSGTAGEKNNSNSNAVRFSGPWGIAYDGSTYLYVADNTGNAIRKITAATGGAATLAGPTNGSSGESDGTGGAATFTGPMGIAYDGSTYLYVCDNGGNKIRRITVSSGAVLTIAGSGTASESDNATGTSATFNGPAGIVYDGSGNLYVSDAGGNTIRKISTTAPYAVTTVAGSGSAGSANGTGTTASFNAPHSLTRDASGNIIIADEGNNLVRTMTTAGVVTTLAGSGTSAEVNGVGTAAQFISPYSVTADNAGNLFAGDNNGTSSTCRKVLLTGYTISPTTLPTGLAFAGTTGIISGTPTAIQSATSYLVTGYNASSSGTYTISIQCIRTTNWNGTTSSAWDVGTNWSTGAAPTANDVVNIGNGSTFTNQPAISNANALAYSLTFGTTKNAAINISAGLTLTVSKSLTVLSTATPTITGGNSSTSIINMNPGAGISVSSTGSLALNTLNLVLQSDSTGDAYIGPVTSTTLTGSALSNVTVQRWLKGDNSLIYRGYRLLTSPVYAATVSGNHVWSLNYLLSSMYATATTVGKGFDNTVPANPSLYLFRENLTNPSSGSFTSGNFRGIDDISAPPTYGMNDATYPSINIPVANGLLCFFRGARSAGTFSTETHSTYIPQSVTAANTGTINIGNVTVTDWFTPTSSNLSYTAASPLAGFNLVGNPYPSAIDWDTFQTTGLANGGIYGTATVSKSIWVLDPISHNYGVYMSGTGFGTDNASNIISSGQGFFVFATGTTPVQPALTFTESAKTSSQNTGNNLLMGKPVNANNRQYLRLKLARDTSNAEDIVVAFNDQATNNYNSDLDALYRQGFGAANLSSISQDNIQMSIHTMPLPKLQQQVLRLYAGANAGGNFTLALKEIKSIPTLYDVWLMDNYLKDSVNMRQNPVYNFTINSDTGSSGGYRFALVIRQNQANTYHLLGFTAIKVPDARQVQINWNTANEGNYTTFTVERSTDGGITYSVIGGVTGSGAGSYGLIDQSPVTGIDMYRLKQEDINNTITYSVVVSVEISHQNSGLISDNLVIYPNPVKNKISVALQNQAADATSYDIRFMNSSGIVVKQITSPDATWEGNVANLEPGTYVIQVLNEKNASLVGQAKFVKM